VNSAASKIPVVNWLCR